MLFHGKASIAVCGPAIHEQFVKVDFFLGS